MDDQEKERTDEVQREVDDRIDDLMREGREMEKRLEGARSDAADVDVPEPEDASGPGVQASELVTDDDDASDESRESED
jgi:hypothetical protein